MIFPSLIFKPISYGIEERQGREEIEEGGAYYE
jgi:hypothetical protein